jgi:hypothetical protein
VFRNETSLEYREAAVDSVLADSFPASDPPSWTLGITRPQPERQATKQERGCGQRTTVAFDQVAGADLWIEGWQK